ncbi:TolC family protein [Sphaerochaeta halotolerans]|uniref:TolC family protein n=2 Tax=Sphaerochaeta halotolerans TaxID=2293840 RepID=A0A372MHK7_9SPIR|nr:TolC family protein [Sphaerochaeta halotolerans]
MVLVLVLILGITSAFSQSLEDIVSKALGESSQMQDLEITKNNALLTQRISDAEEGVGISISSGTVSTTYDPSKNSYEFMTSGVGASFVLPNDGDTTISVSTGKMSYLPNGSAFAISPTVSASHTLTYGYTTDNRQSLANRQTELLATSSYESSKLNFTNTIYKQISSLLENEKAIKQTEKQIADLQRDLQQNLTLKLIREGSLTHETQKQAIASQEATLSGLKASRELLLKQYASLTGTSWEGVDSIPEPVLDFSSNEEGNSNVLMQSLALSMAKEDLALKMAEFENKSLKLSGGIASSTIDTVFNNDKGDINTVTPELSATLSGKQFSLTGKVEGTYDISKNDFTPTVSISGNWSNNPASTADSLTVQKLQNEVLLAEIAYADAKNDYQQSATSLENRIASWNLSYMLLGQTMDYHKQVLEQQQDLAKRGLATQREVDDAAFTSQMDAYDMATTLLEGLQLENEIRILQI